MLNGSITNLNEIGILLITIGIILTAINSQIKEYSIRYDETCKNNIRCTVQLYLPEKMEGPVFFYYGLKNFYQNHRRYIKSRSNPQLTGKSLTVDEIKTSCDPIITNNDLGLSNLFSYSGEPLLKEGVAHPCGLIARSFFNGI